MKIFRRFLYILLALQFMGCSLFFGNDGKNDRGTNTDPQLNRKSVSLLSPQARLKKLSFHLRGIGPSLQEYAELENHLAQGQADLFFTQKISSYLKSPEHLGKMIERLEELFGLNLNYIFAEKEYFEIPEKFKDQASTLNSMNLLVRRVIKENLSWDALFTAKEYQITFPELRPDRPSDLGFFNAIKPDLPPSSDGIIRRGDDTNYAETPERTLMPVIFDSKDSRIGGVITTSRFLNRYNTTLLNKNRKRAAALFRILLCDDMKPTIAANEDISDILQKSFPRTDSSPNAAVTDQIKHGTLQSCMACHQKLDPMGEVFRTTGNILSPEAANGALVYPTHDGRTVNIPVSGVGQLTEVISEQPEYAQCQVRHFWNWFIGKDKTLTTEHLNFLTQEFERVKRKPNDFIPILLQQREFQEDESGSFSRTAIFSQVLPLLTKCTNCHIGVTSKKIPSFAKMPFGDSKETHKKWVHHIAKSLDLAGDGSKAKMPTADSGWKLTLEDRENIRNWINQGAQDDHGVKTIDDEFSVPNQDPKPANKSKVGAFGYVGLRYLSSNDLLRLFKQKFPLTWKYKIIASASGNVQDSGELTCIGSMDRKALGFFNPANIETFSPSPSMNYVKWISKCILAFSKVEFELIKKEKLDFDKYLGQKTIAAITGTTFEALRKDANAFKWSELTPEIKSQITTHLIQDFIGQNVALREKEIIKRATVATENTPGDLTTEAMQRILLTALLQDEFLTY